MKSLFTVLVIVAIHLMIAAAQADSFLPLPGNLNGDNKVDLSDLRLFADQWLDPSGCVDHPDDCADLT
ncbi:MAG: hypothetical protein K9M75_02460, partial [Phycisphaerae bacterium]|nr:hypothetical protein [Phycisphaerae bacterium]